MNELRNSPDASPPSVSVVVPVYNSESTIETLVERIEVTLSSRGADFEVILVNDCSRDRSWEIIRRLVETRVNIRGIDLMRNYGQHAAILRGIRSARHDVVVTLDDDLQNPPEEIPKLLDRLAQGYDVVYGISETRRHGAWRNVASGISRLFLRSVTPTPVARIVTGFRAFRTPVRNAFAGYASPFVFIDALLPWATTRFAAVSVRHEPRRTGASNYTFWKLLTLGVDMMTGFSTLPLRFASLVGFAFTLFGMGVLVYVLGRYLLLGYSVPGFPFLASTVAIFSGAQLFAIGIIGEYLARMHFRSMGRPVSVEREVIGFPTESENQRS